MMTCFLFFFFLLGQWLFSFLLTLCWFLALEQKEGIKKSSYPRRGESREMAKAIPPPFHYILYFFLALSSLERLKEEIRRAGSCFTPFLLLIDFAGNHVFPWDILIWQKKRTAWYQEQLSVEWGSQNVWKDGVMFSMQYFGMLCRLSIVSRDILAGCWGWMGRAVRGCLERFGGTAVLGAALVRLEGHPRVPSQIGAAWGTRLRVSRSRVECPRHGFGLTVFVAAARPSRLTR